MKDIDEMDIQHDFATAQRGAVNNTSGKTRITIFLDNDVLEQFRQVAKHSGRGYQTEINQCLRESLSTHTAKLEPRSRAESSAVVIFAYHGNRKLHSSRNERGLIKTGHFRISGA